jgi:hypothetical protein
LTTDNKENEQVNIHESVDKSEYGDKALQTSKTVVVTTEKSTTSHKNSQDNVSLKNKTQKINK